MALGGLATCAFAAQCSAMNCWKLQHSPGSGSELAVDLLTKPINVAGAWEQLRTLSWAPGSTVL